MSKNEILTKVATEVDKLLETSEEIIAKSVGKASAIAAVPVPVLDIAGVTYIQVAMIEKLANLHGVHVEEKGKLIVSSVISALLSKLISEAVITLTVDSSLNKLLGDSLVKASISGFATTITGEVYNNHFKNGGNIESMSPSVYIDYFQEQMNSDRISIEKITSGIIDNAMSKFGLN